MQGSVLDKRYEIIQPLGRGFFGATYLAKDIRRMGRQCVVKHLQPGSNDPYTLQEAKKLFESEARTLEKLGQHDQIPDLLDYFQENNEFYLVQELVEGYPLNTEILSNQKLAETEVKLIVKDVLEVLSYVHKCQVIHRDIKPNNLMRRHKDRKIVLIDFGAVKQVRTQVVNAQGQTSFTQVIGTPGYMPDEQLRGQPQFNSDIYALGITAIQALSGVAPTEFPSDPRTGEVIWHGLVEINPELRKILDKMVRSHWMDRYQSVDEVLQDLQKLSARQTPLPNPSPPRKFKLILGGAILVLGLGGLGSLAYINSVSSQTEKFFKAGVEKVEKQDWKEAIADFDKVIQSHPSNGEAYLYRGNAYYQLKESKKAIEDYTQALRYLVKKVAGIGVQWQSEPQTKTLTILSVQENSPAAQAGIKAGDQILAIDGNSTENITVEEATKQIQSGKEGTPVTLRIGREGGEFTLTFNRIDIVNRKYAEAYHKRGHAHYQLGDKQAAVEDYTQAIQTDANFDQAYYSRGYVRHYDFSDKQAAIDDYNQAIQLNPNYTAAYINRGHVRLDLGNKQSAINDYNQAIRINSNYSLAYYSRGNVRFDLGNKQAAIEDYTRAIEANSDWGTISLVDAYFKRGFAYQDLGNQRAAIEDYNQAIRLNPKYAAAYNNRGNARSELGNKQAALDDYTEAIRINSNYYLAYYNRGLVYQERGDKQAAIDDYTQTIRINPNYESAYYNRGLAYQDSGDKQAAINDYTKAININPNKANAYYNRGIVRSQLGEKQSAIADYQKAAQLYQEQGKTKDYQNALTRISLLQR
ncbi:tetratricopeptide repeat protein [Chlorogloeopsis sp. ULAP02]|uniref:tetratricopeptide repeat protein n=1 Tax=Chlorogloeopsis sp. ULAP02 TaxID=3107926 RepID=UPI0031349C60